MNNFFKILVACHNPTSVYHNRIYTPIHVGRKISTYNNDMSEMIGDDTGDNISSKNPNYCELTAQYWAWKNLDCEYVGLCHYRRFFNTKYDERNITKVFNKYDVILAKHIVCSTNLLSRLIISSSQEDAQLFFSVIKKIYPDYYDVALKYVLSNNIHGYNMFVMRKGVFDKFAEWQFSLLFEFEKYVKLSGYTRGQRIFGYYAEVLLPIYCIKNKLRIKEEPVVAAFDSYRYTMKDFLHDIYYKLSFKFSPQRCLNDSATLVGLKSDFRDSDIIDYIDFSGSL